MLDLMRRKAQSPYLQATVLAIILVFIFWGVGNQGGNAPNSVATVNGTSIDYRDYEKAYNQAIDQYRQQFGGSMPESLLKTLNVKEQVLGKLIDRVLILQEADKIGIHISDEEVRNAIQKIPSFQVNGVFSVNTYKDILAASRMTVGDFESSIRSDLLSRKVIDALSKFGIAPEYDLQARFNYENSAVKLAYVKFDAERYKADVKVTDEELQGYFDKHKTDYQSAEQRKLKYLSFLTSDAQKEEPTDEEIRAYYDQNMAAFTVPEKRRARHILIKTAVGDSDKEKAAKRQLAEEILAKARKGEDFAKLATAYSEDSTASAGGDLGYFERGRMVKSFDDAVFAMNKGDISDVVETPFGFHIIKLEDVTPARVKPLEEVRPLIIARLQQEKGQNQAIAAANAAYEQIMLAGSLEKYAESSGSTLQETGFFEKKNPPQGIVADPAFLNAAFSLGKGELSSLVEMSEGYAIIYVSDIKPPEVPALETVKDKVQKDYIDAKAREIAAQKAADMLAAVRGGKKFDAMAAEYGVKIEESAYFSRQNPYGTDLPTAVVQEGIKLSSVLPYPEKEISEGDASYVFRFAEKKETDPAVFSEKSEQYEEQLKDENTNALMAAWLNSLREKAEIEKNEKLM